MFLSPVAMHIPDGFLSVLVSVILWIFSIALVAYGLRRVGKELGEQQLPLMGVLAAAIFAGQMLNFTVFGGTSGHLMGAAIATILVGPWAAILVITTVVGVQALIFQDGGLVVLGATIFNMAIVGVTVSYMAFRLVQRIDSGCNWGLFVGGFLAAWLSVEIASLSVALQLALSGTSPANLAIPTMAGIHALIGIGEGLITVGALAFLNAARPDMLVEEKSTKGSNAILWVGGLLIALLLAIASPLASAHPDGLEWVADQQGFLGADQGPLYKVIPDYVLPGISNEALATILAGVLGVVIILGVTLAMAFTRRNRQTTGS